jgi:hypothetical protein
VPLTEIHAGMFVTLHGQPLPVLTVIVPVPPSAPIERLPGLTV